MTPAPRPSPPPIPPRPGTGLVASFGHAWNGLIHTVVHQRNMRIHLVSAVLVSLVGSGIPLGLAEKVTLLFCVQLIFFAEILNSALEHLVDLAVQQFDEKARVAKDAAAAGVLVLAIGTVVIFAALLVHNRETIRASGPQIARQAVLGAPLAACAGLLAHRWRRPVAVDVALLALALVLWALVLPRTASYVFSAMTFGLLVVSAAAARHLRRDGLSRPRSQRP